MNKRFYGFEYKDGVDTTTGQPNQRTMRLNRAGYIGMFDSKKERDSWVAEGSDSYGGRVATNRAELKSRFCAGETMAEFEEHLEMLDYLQINDL